MTMSNAVENPILNSPFAEPAQHYDFTGLEPRILPGRRAAGYYGVLRTEKVTGALAKLPMDYRLVLTLRDVEGLSTAETAKILKLSAAAVKSRLHRGRLFLRDEFERAFGAKESKR